MIDSSSANCFNSLHNLRHNNLPIHVLQQLYSHQIQDSQDNSQTFQNQLIQASLDDTTHHPEPEGLDGVLFTNTQWHKLLPNRNKIMALQKPIKLTSVNKSLPTYPNSFNSTTQGFYSSPTQSPIPASAEELIAHLQTTQQNSQTKTLKNPEHHKHSLPKLKKIQVNNQSPIQREDSSFLKEQLFQISGAETFFKKGERIKIQNKPNGSLKQSSSARALLPKIQPPPENKQPPLEITSYQNKNSLFRTLHSVSPDVSIKESSPHPMEEKNEIDMAYIQGRSFAPSQIESHHTEKIEIESSLLKKKLQEYFKKSHNTRYSKNFLTKGGLQIKKLNPLPLPSPLAKNSPFRKTFANFPNYFRDKKSKTDPVRLRKSNEKMEEIKELTQSSSNDKKLQTEGIHFNEIYQIKKKIRSSKSNEQRRHRKSPSPNFKEKSNLHRILIKNSIMQSYGLNNYFKAKQQPQIKEEPINIKQIDTEIKKRKIIQERRLTPLKLPKKKIKEENRQLQTERILNYDQLNPINCVEKYAKSKNRTFYDDTNTLTGW